MKATTALASLVRQQDALTMAKWIELIREQVASIRPFMQSFTLPSLGILPIVHYGEGEAQSIDDHRKLPGCAIIGRQSLREQCLFPKESAHNFSFPEHDDHGRTTTVNKRFWALRRDCQWLVIEVWLDISYKERNPRAADVTCTPRGYDVIPALIDNPKFFDFVGRTPGQVWYDLVEAFEELVRIREESLGQARKLLAEQEHVKFLLDLIREKP